MLGCPASRQYERPDVEDSSPAARLGSAVHRALRLSVEEGDLDYDVIMDEYDLDDSGRTDFPILVNTGRKLWREIISKGVPVPQCENKTGTQLSPEVELTGP